MAQTPLKSGPFRCRFSTFFPTFGGQLPWPWRAQASSFIWEPPLTRTDTSQRDNEPLKCFGRQLFIIVPLSSPQKCCTSLHGAIDLCCHKFQIDSRSGATVAVEHHCEPNSLWPGYLHTSLMNSNQKDRNQRPLFQGRSLCVINVKRES